MKHFKTRSPDKDQGFTIVETLISMAVFSIVLLVLTAGIITITNTYYKGITESTTQNTSRNVINDISQAIEFSGSGVLGTQTPVSPGTAYAFCIGSQRYSYQLGYEVKSNPAPAPSPEAAHALTVDNVANCSASTSNITMPGGTLTNNASQDLVGQNMRLATLSVSPDLSIPNLYQIQVKVVYGDTDLLCSPNPPAGQLNVCLPANINTTIPTSELADPDLTCKGNAGTQFCGVSQLSTIVERRVQ